jgi:HlyD family secretion protein
LTLVPLDPTATGGSAVPIPLAGPRAVPARPPIGAVMVFGLTAAFLGFGGFIAWAALAPLAGGAVAPGLVRVDTHAKAVQHRDGGIIAELLVREGDRVAAGQVLVRLDEVENRAALSVLAEEHDALAAQQARLEAERDERDGLRFSPDLERRRGEPHGAEMLAAQERVFATRHQMLTGQIAIINQRLEQQAAQVRALEAQLEAGTRQLGYIREELVGVQQLVDKGLERRPRLLALQRTAASLEGQQGDWRGRIAALSEDMTGSRLQIGNLRTDRARQVAEELRDVQVRLGGISEKLATARVRLARQDVVSPQAGRVMNLKVFAPGAVVAPGGTILEIVPEEEQLYIDARVLSRNIDVVREGLPAQVVLTPYRQRVVPHLDGRVVRVSPDVVQDEHGGQPYYLTRVEVAADQLARLDGVRLYPGMPTEVIVIAEERTMLDYLLQPVRDSFRHAFREK